MSVTPILAFRASVVSGERYRAEWQPLGGNAYTALLSACLEVAAQKDSEHRV
ncbi:MAG: hypothetical protein ACFBSF_22635 [Leptolyngbyaceae cyanobacterium]